MRLETIRARGLGPFRDEVVLDLRELPPILAVTGPNGAGKSTLLELFLGAIDREMPTRGALAKIATARDSLVEARVVNGAPYTIRQLVDVVSGKGEAVVLDGAGAPLVESAKLRDFDVWRAAHLPPREVLLASIFAAQGAGGFLTMKPGERKAVLLRVLGIERLEQLAERARSLASMERANLDGHDRALAELTAAGGDVAAAEQAVEEARRELERAEAAAAQADVELAELRDRAAAAEAALRAQTEDRARRRSLSDQIVTTRSRIADLEERIRNNRAVLDRREEIAAAVARKCALEATSRDAAIAASRAADAAEALRASQSGTALARTAAARRLERAEGQAQRHRAFLDEWRPRVRAALAALDSLRAAEEAARKAEEAARAAVLQHIEKANLAVNDRLYNLRRALLAVVEAEALDAAHAAARAGLDRDDSAEALRDEYRPLELARHTAQDAHGAAKHARIAAEQDAAVNLTDAEGELATAEASRADASEEIARLDADLPRLTEEIAAHAAAERAARETLARAQGELRGVEEVAKLSDALGRAEARLAELQPQLDALRAECSTAEEQLASMGPVPDAPPVPDLAPAKGRLVAAETDARKASAALASVEQRLESVRVTAARIAEVETARATAAEELADWTRLGDDLGRDGLQALEIDAAGPEITTLTNDLLHEAFGPRFTVRLDTTRPKADGKGQVEVFDVTVIDTVRGREARAETLSGGERVIISEALSLALTMVACRRAGVEGPTLVRDESGAALDPDNARAYVAMLRRAAVQVGASHVLFVSHSPEVQELADARVHVENGKVEVRR